MPDHPSCIADRFPRAAIDAMMQEAARPVHDDGHTDCYYAGLLAAALPHLVTEETVEDALAAYFEWTYRPDSDAPQAMRAALAAALSTEEVDRG